MCVNRGGGGGGGGSLEESHQKTWDSLSRAERDAITRYTADDYTEINSYLLEEGGIPVFFERDIKNIDAALSKSIVPHDVVVYRGVDSDGYNAMVKGGLLDNGAVFEHKNYMSTTLSRDIATTFTRDTTGSKADPENILIVKVPKGSKGLYLGGKVGTKYGSVDDNELLLPRGTQLKTIRTKLTTRNEEMATFSLGGGASSITKTPGKRYVRITEVEVVGQPKRPLPKARGFYSQSGRWVSA